VNGVRLEFDHFLISDEKTLLNMETIAGFMSRSYWAHRRSKDRIEKSVMNSICYGVYDGNKQIGFARVVTDHATMYWLCDVFIDEAYRGRGIGKKLIKTITESEELKDLMGVLGTQDAHGLYRQYHFEEDKDRMMRRMPDYARNMKKSP